MFEGMTFGITGMAIIRAIVAGERNPQVLAAEIAQALTGDYCVEHIFVLRQELQFYEVSLFCHSGKVKSRKN